MTIPVDVVELLQERAAELDSEFRAATAELLTVDRTGRCERCGEELCGCDRNDRLCFQCWVDLRPSEGT